MIQRMAKKARDAYINVAVTSADKAAIERAAADLGWTVSEYARAAILTTMLLRGHGHALKALLVGAANVADEMLENLKGKRRTSPHEFTDSTMVKLR